MHAERRWPSVWSYEVNPRRPVIGIIRLNMRATRVLAIIGFTFVLSACLSKSEKDASREGYERALKDVATRKLECARMDSEELISSFVPSEGARKYGGHDYYFKYLTNLAIIEELRTRGMRAVDALRNHVGDDARIYEAINGPGSTVGLVCKDLLTKIQSEAQPSDAPDANGRRR